MWKWLSEMKEQSKLGNGFTATIRHAGTWWIGWIEEISGVNGQERTRDELLDSLRITLAEA
jgi:hypothetical protein